jgi:hypothetical protein
MLLFLMHLIMFCYLSQQKLSNYALEKYNKALDHAKTLHISQQTATTYYVQLCRSKDLTSSGAKEKGEYVDYARRICSCKPAEEIPCGHLICVAQSVMGKDEDILDDQHLPTFFHRCFTVDALIEAYSVPVFPATDVSLEVDSDWTAVAPTISSVKSQKQFDRITTKTEIMTQQAAATLRAAYRCTNCGSDTHTRITPCPLGPLTADAKATVIARTLLNERTRVEALPAPVAHAGSGLRVNPHSPPIPFMAVNRVTFHAEYVSIHQGLIAEWLAEGDRETMANQTATNESPTVANGSHAEVSGVVADEAHDQFMSERVDENGDSVLTQLDGDGIAEQVSVVGSPAVVPSVASTVLDNELVEAQQGTAAQQATGQRIRKSSPKVREQQQQEEELQASDKQAPQTSLARGVGRAARDPTKRKRVSVPNAVQAVSEKPESKKDKKARLEVIKKYQASILAKYPHLSEEERRTMLEDIRLLFRSPQEKQQEEQEEAAAKNARDQQFLRLLNEVQNGVNV